MSDLLGLMAMLVSGAGCYGLGRNHESLWWLRALSRANDHAMELHSAGAVNADYCAGHVEAQQDMMASLARREVTWTGRWFGISMGGGRR